MSTRRTLLGTAAAAALVGGHPLARAAPPPRFGAKRDTLRALYIVRHAEKAGGKDPPLTEAGVARTAALVRLLAHVPMQAVYSTETRRTRQTAAPIARAKGLAVTPYAARPARALADTLRSSDAQTALIVGHSNTIPGLIAAFGLDAGTEELADYEDLFLIVLPAGGQSPLLQRLRFGAPSPTKGPETR